MPLRVTTPITIPTQAAAATSGTTLRAALRSASRALCHVRRVRSLKALTMMMAKSENVTARNGVYLMMSRIKRVPSAVANTRPSNGNLDSRGGGSVPAEDGSRSTAADADSARDAPTATRRAWKCTISRSDR